MVALQIFRDYLVWHYTRAFVDIFVIWRNVTHFVFNFFSVPLLLKTLFQPWKRIEARRETEGFDVKDWIETLGVNIIMRIVGAIMRLFFIAFGLACVAAVVLLGLQFFVLWFFLPFTLVMLMTAGVTLVFFM